jgi:proteic killer suppression protein
VIAAIDVARYYWLVIGSFADKTTRTIWQRQRVPALSEEIQRAALRRLTHLEAATKLEDLKVPPGNRLEKLVGNRAGQYSIRVNDQYRICFEWDPGTGTANNIQFTDYH